MSVSTPTTVRRIYALLPVFVAIAGALLVVGLSLARRPADPPLRTYGLVPDFTLTESSGKTVTNRDLAGKIWVADFIYTTCPGPCPIISAHMAQLQSALTGDSRVQLVSFTVDPRVDTPAVLTAYAGRLGADPQRWWFLTGPEKPLYHLIQDGFYQVVEDNRGQPLQEGQFTVTHSTKMVLVDGDGVMRGFYDGVGPDGRSELLKGIKTLEKESPE